MRSDGVVGISKLSEAFWSFSLKGSEEAFNLSLGLRMIWSAVQGLNAEEHESEFKGRASLHPEVLERDAVV